MSVRIYVNSIQKVGFDAANEPTITGETFTCSGGETTDPGYDLLDNRRTNVITYDSNGETTTIKNRIDLTSVIDPSFVIIDNHNFGTCDAWVTINYDAGETQRGMSTAFSGALGSELSTETVTSDQVRGDIDDGVLLINIDLDGESVVWWVQLDDNGDGYDDDITIGEFCLGNSFAPAHNPELQPVFDYDMPGSSFRESEGSQRYGFSTHTNDRRSWRLMWKFISDADKSNLEDIFLVTRGMKHPFYIDLGPILGATNPQLFYVRFMRPLSFKGLTKDAWQVTIDIEEEL